MLDVIRDLWKFARERKKMWLIPLIATVVLIGLLAAASEYSVAAPFIYALF